MWIDQRGSEVLTLSECRHLLATGAEQHRHGHLGIPRDGAPLVLPVDYAVRGPDVVVRVGEGLFARLVDRLVSFQVDGVAGPLGPEGFEGRRPWSVLVRGLAVEGEPSPGPLPVPEVAEPGARLVRIRADVVTGRRLGPAPEVASSAGAGSS